MPVAAVETILSSIEGMVGACYVLSDGDFSKWSTDWKGQYVGRPLAVVRPADVRQVSEVIAYCNANHIKIVPQGGNTGMVAGAIPDNSGEQIVLDLTRLNQVRKIEASNLAIHVDAGVTLHQVRLAAEAAGLQFPLSMGSEGTCTVGGNIATNAGGTQVLRYGNMRDLTLGLECVLADGSVWDGMRSLRKDNTGYNLRDLLIGSEGTLAVITGAVLKLYPAHLHHQAAWIRIAGLNAALDLLNLARQESGDQLTAFEIMNAHSLALVKQYLPDRQLPFVLDDDEWAVLLQLSFGTESGDSEESIQLLMERALENGLIEDAAIAVNGRQVAEFWQIREGVALAQVNEGPNIKHDVALPIGRVPEFVTAARRVLAELVPGIRFVEFGHLGDGNLHYNIQAPAGQDAKQFVLEHTARINSVVNALVCEREGSISAEHGIGATKVEALESFEGPLAIQLMRRIKQALDPRGTLNPGKVLV